MVKKMSTDEFIRRARIVHGDKYDYSKSDCENRDNKGRVCIICHKLDGNGNEHGEFWQRPNSHIRGDGCRKCSNENTSRINSRKQSKTREEFITDANNVHHGKYSYDKAIYVNSHTKITITCPIHGDFTQTPTNHLQGKGCPKCANKEVTRDEPEYGEAQRMLSFLRFIDSIEDDDQIVNNSIIREFIGGSILVK